ISRMVQESARGSGAITGHIGTVAQATRNASQSSRQVEDAAKELGRLAAGLLLGVFQETPGGPAPQHASPPQEPKRDLSELSLEELSNMEVTTASRKAQRLADVAAAVTVIRGDDL